MGNSYRTGKSYRKPRPRIIVTDPKLHRLKGAISQLKREIRALEDCTRRLGLEFPGLGQKREQLAALEKQLKGMTR